MSRRSALILAVCSVAVAATMAVLLSQRSAVSRVTYLGTLHPSLPAATVSSTPAPPPVVQVPPISVWPVETTAGAPAWPDAVVPVRLTIGRIGVLAPVVPTGVQAGTNMIQIPDLDQVGWYRFGARPGEDGSAVLVGHVDGAGRTGIFWRLRELAPGDRLSVGFSDGSTRRFFVSGRQEFAKQAVPADLFSRQGPPRLALITCGGPFDPASGHYLDNVVVVATPIT